MSTNDAMPEQPDDGEAPVVPDVDAIVPHDELDDSVDPETPAHEDPDPETLAHASDADDEVLAGRLEEGREGSADGRLLD